jgi:hypothetical protein
MDPIVHIVIEVAKEIIRHEIDKSSKRGERDEKDDRDKRK